MTPERYAQIKRIFLEALARPPAERESFVDSACGGSSQLCAEVWALLESHQEGDAGLPTEVLGSSAEVAAHLHLEPGSRVADRYLIIDQLGRGGMGAVYRARDELLDTVVALKFPLGTGTNTTSDLLREVRLSREITHPAVCRVFDVGQVEGQPFFTMEYVDGEDLASQVRRFGKLSPDKALDIARQVATGIAAAHAKGILHRDLKPANVLVDSQGQVRITDFGIAVAFDQSSRAALAGTPGYMAPEQLIPGREVTERADIYAWGVLVWELLTGRPRFKPTEVDDLIQAQLRSAPEPPSSIVADVPPRLDRAVRRAMSLDPVERPSSALELLSLLGGDDVLDVARAINVTPSPEFVARSSHPGTTSWPRVLAWVGGTLAALIFLGWIVDREEAMDPALARAPAVLRERAIEVLERLGYPAPSRDVDTDNGYLPDLTVPDPANQILFWYTRDLSRARKGYSLDVLDRPGELVGLDLNGPRLVQLRVLLSPDGRLVFFQADAIPDSVPPDADVDEVSVRELTGLNELTELGVMPNAPPVFADRTVRWAAGGGSSVVDAAFVGARPVYLAVHRNPDHAELLVRRMERRGHLEVVMIWVLLVLLISIPLAWRNVRRGRADRVGAFRVTIFVFSCSAVSALFRSGHVVHPHIPEGFAGLETVLGLFVGTAAAWTCYVGLEPAIRRYWPRTLVEWAQVLHGNTRNPRLGLTLLVGTCFGVLWAALARADTAVWLERQGDTSFPSEGYRLDAVLDPWQVLATIVDNTRVALYQTLLILLTLVLARNVLRIPWLATLGFVLLHTTIFGLLGSYFPGSLLTLGLPLAATSCFLLLRFGLVTHAIATMIMNLLVVFVFDLDLDTWYGLGLQATLLMILGLVGTGAWLATREATVRA